MAMKNIYILLKNQKWKWAFACLLTIGLSLSMQFVRAQSAQNEEQSDNFRKIGDLITFSDGSKGIVCYVNPNNPYTGWAMALTEIDVTSLFISPSGVGNLYDMRDSSRNLRTRINSYDAYNWKSLGKENTEKLLALNSPVAQVLLNSEYDYNEGWYIPDIMQLNLWFSLIPIIQDDFINNGGTVWVPSANQSRMYWSSSREGSNIDYMVFPSGQMSPVDPKRTSGAYLRPVRDFHIGEAIVYWDSLAAEENLELRDTTNRMKVGPQETTTYGATVEFGTYTFPLSGTVVVHESHDHDTIRDIVCLRDADPYVWHLYDNYTQSAVNVPVRMTQAGSDTTRYTLHTTSNCDSIVTLILRVVGSCEYIIKDTICPIKEGESYHYAKTFVEPETYDGTVKFDTTFSYGTSANIYEHHEIKSYVMDDTKSLEIIVYYALFFHPTYQFEKVDEVCNNIPNYEWRGQEIDYRTPGTTIYWDSLKTVKGECDSIYKLTLTVKETTSSDTDAVACDHFTWYGSTYTESGTYTRTVTNAAGCDSVITLRLTVNPSPKVNIEPVDSICHWVGHAQLIAVTTPGTGTTATDYTYTWQGFLHPTHTVQSIDKLSDTTTVNFPTDTSSCGVSYPMWVKVVDNFGCAAYDTTLVTMASVTPRIISSLTDQDMECDWDGVTGAPTVDDFTVVNRCAPGKQVTLLERDVFESGCLRSKTWVATDTSGCGNPAEPIRVTYTWGATVHTYDTVKACDSYTWRGKTFTKGGDYSDTLKSVCGCDSVVWLLLDIYNSTHMVIPKDTCGSYRWWNTEYTESGTYVREYINSDGCPSADTLKLTVYPKYSATKDTVVCGSFEWEGDTYTSSGDYTKTLHTVNGCDSVVTIHLTVKPMPELTVNPKQQEVCYGETATFEPTVTGCGRILYEENFQHVTSGNGNQIENLSEQAPLFATANAVYGGGGNSIRLGKTTPYTYGEITTKPLNLEEDFVLTLSMKGWGSSNLVPTRLVVSVGEGAAVQTDSVTLPGYTDAGQYERYPFSFHAAGPDAVITIKAINETQSGYNYTEERFYINHVLIQDNAACTLAWSDAAGNPVSASGDHSLTVTASETTTYTVTATTSKSCTASQSVDLAVKKKSYGDTTVTVCGSFTWYGVEYTTVPDPLPTHTFTNAAGCDSVVTLHLTLNALIEVEKDTTVCGAFEWDGDTYTTSQTVKKTFTSSLGCDSVVTMEVTVNPVDSVHYDEESVCAGGTYNAHGFTYTAPYSTHPSVHRDTIRTTNAHGCDSIVTLTLTVNPVDSVHYDKETVCAGGTYNAHGFTYTAPYSTTGSVHRDTIRATNVHGCDSIVTLTLTVNPMKTTSLDGEICLGESYTANGFNITPTEAGTTTHTLSLTTAKDCDSIVTLTLTTYPNPVVNVNSVADLCPNVGSVELTATVTATTADYTYEWSGDLTVAPATNTTSALSSTAVATIPSAPNSCGQTYYESVKVTDAHNCVALASFSIVVRMPATPVITASAADHDFECEPALGIPTFTVADDCEGIFTLPADSVTDGGVISTGTYTYSHTWTAHYTDACGNHAADKSVTYTWTVAPEVTITCPPDHYDTLAFGDCVMNIYPEQIGIPTINAPSDWPFEVSNDIPADNLYQEGETIITWVVTDPVCGYSASCEQKVIVVFPKCPDAIDCEGNVYHGVRIDCDCWTQTNLVSNCYGDANECVETGNCDDPIPCVFEYESGFHPNVDENVEIYGKLYCDTAGVGDSTVNEHGHIRGICPEGWYLPTVEKYADLFLHGDALKSPLYWTDGGGDNSTGFSWLPAGWYNGALQRFEGMGSEGYFLAVETTVEGFRTMVFTMQHDCDEVKRIETHQGFGYSVRCVKEKD